MALDLQRGCPPSREGLIQRSRLIAKLRHDPDVPLLAIIAPAGYGKTSLLREWLGVEDRPSAWVTLKPRHNDPPKLLRDVAGALSEIEGFGATLVLDDLHELQHPDALLTVAEIAEPLPAGVQLALASRTEPPLQLGRLRAHHAVCELRSEDLSMDH